MMCTAKKINWAGILNVNAHNESKKRGNEIRKVFNKVLINWKSYQVKYINPVY